MLVRSDSLMRRNQGRIICARDLLDRGMLWGRVKRRMHEKAERAFRPAYNSDIFEEVGEGKKIG